MTGRKFLLTCLYFCHIIQFVFWNDFSYLQTQINDRSFNITRHMWPLGNEKYFKFLVLDVCLRLSKAANDNKRGRPNIFSFISTFKRLPSACLLQIIFILGNVSSTVNKSFRNIHFIWYRNSTKKKKKQDDLISNSYNILTDDNIFTLVRYTFYY